MSLASVTTESFVEQQQTVRVRRFLMASVTYLLAIAIVTLGVLLGILNNEVLVVYTVVVLSLIHI